MDQIELFTSKDLETNQEIRWCPGCGDYSILKQVQKILPELGRNKEDFVFVSGIGCSSRFPYYMETYGMHSIHGRAMAIATGLKTARPELSVWVVTGDGDGLSIGGNHLIHTLRRNPDINILLFNNQIYGLTKGQFSPTSEQGKITKSSPYGTAEAPFNPLALALGAGATFIARTTDRDVKHLQEMLKAGYYHKGSSFLEIYQNCNVFNDGAFELFTEKESKPRTCVYLQHNEPLLFGNNNQFGVIINHMKPEVVNIENHSVNDLWIHDENDKTKAFLLTQMFEDNNSENALPRPFGIFYKETRSSFEELINFQVAEVIQKRGSGNLDSLLGGANTWIVV